MTSQHRILTPTSSFAQLFLCQPNSKQQQPVDSNSGKENPTPVTKYSHPNSPSRLAAHPVTALTNQPRTMVDSPHLQSAYATALSSPYPSALSSPYPSPPLAASQFAPPPSSHFSPPPAARPAPPPQPYSYHRPTGHAAEPTMVQLLASTPSGVSGYASRLQGQDATMGAATGVASWRKGQGFKQWEKVLLESPEVRRKADVAQLCESSLSAWPDLPGSALSSARGSKKDG